MAVELKVPQAGESISEMTVAQWLKSEGDEVERDEVVATIETEKASLEISAPESGTLAEIRKKAGDSVEVGEVIGLLEPAGDGAGRKAKKKDRGTRARKEKEKEKDAKERRAGKARAGGDRKETRGKADDGTDEDGSGGVRVMPAARRLLEEHELSPEEVEASGPGGRLLKEDVLRHIGELPEEDEEDEEEREESEQAEGPGEEEVAGETEESVSGRREEAVPMSPLRRHIARRLVKATQQAALLTTFNEIDMSAAIALRRRFQDAFRERYEVKLGYMSFFVKAVVEALKAVPELNAEVRGDDIVYRDYYDIGVAVGGGKGLVVPVLRNAERLSFAEIERSIDDYARRARENALDLEELQGGTFTISNGGVYGSLLSTPIVNPPQSGVLGMHRIEERPVAREGEVVIRPMMYVALTYDHRIVDGREAVTFLKRVKELVEAPERILLEV